MADTVLKAPFNGIIARRYVENHEHIPAQVPVVSVQDISSVEVIAQLPEILVAQHGMDKLQGFQVNFDADGSRWFNAAVLEFSSQADPTTRTFDVVVKLTPPENLQILPGMTAAVQVSIANGSHDSIGMTLVPVEAVWGDNDKQSYVWVINETTGRAIKTLVTVGAFKNKELEILSGLENGEKVAVAGLKYLNETMTVRPISDHEQGLDR